ncbi:MAG: addiction module protein [Planctomycetes bacterium RIFOXYD12_FULL_42_12]|nr:MAG: addiction module protein [Planctomycetes bacterium RIFOXYD12_FULL_42_12]
MTAKELIEEAESMPVETRALMVDSLLKSLNTPSSSIDEEWGALAEKRLKELRSGTVIGIPGDQVFERVWKRFEK